MYFLTPVLPKMISRPVTSRNLRPGPVSKTQAGAGRNLRPVASGRLTALIEAPNAKMMEISPFFSASLYTFEVGHTQ